MLRRLMAMNHASISTKLQKLKKGGQTQCSTLDQNETNPPCRNISDYLKYKRKIPQNL